MEENKDKKSAKEKLVGDFKEKQKNLKLNQMDLSECSKYQELNGSWVIWLAISAIILCFKNLYGGIALLIASIIIFILYKKSPKNISATYFNLALDYIGNDNMDKAKDALKKAIEVNPKNNIAYILLASIYYRNGDCEQTIENLLKTDNIEDSKYSFIVGECYFREEDYSNAIKYLNFVKYEKEDPMNEIKTVLLAKAYSFMKQYKKSINEFNKISNIKDQLKGDKNEFDYCLAVAYLNLGKKKKALDILKDIYKEDNNYKDVESLLKEI